MAQLDNAAVAREMELTADLLEVAGADKFRFLSYRKAANSIRAWPEQLSSLAEEGRLTDIPGVGAKLAVSITELFHHGTFPELEQAKSAFPPGLVEVMQVSGVGPKRARQFFDSLGVDSPDALLAAIDSDELVKLGGMGAKTVDNIRRGLESYLRHRGRMLLSDAQPLAERIAETLRAHDLILEALPAGSLRRMQETVGDIDIVASSVDAPAAMAAVRALPDVDRIIAGGDSKTSFRTSGGVRVDVRVVAPEEFGAALQYFTGSAEHNVHLRQRAKRRGLKVNEYGVYRLDAGGNELERVAGATERDVYAALGIPNVPPPEIRHDTGEIEAAEKGVLPRLLEISDVRGDLHAHTTSTDAHSTLAENRAMAAQLGYEYIGVSDHAYDLRMVRGLSVAQLEEQWAAADALNADGAGMPRILKGIELNIGPGGRVDYDTGVLARFDYCIASLHSGWNEGAAEITARLLDAMDNPYVDIIGHPTGRILGRRDPLPLDMERVLARAAETGTIMEINAYPDRLDLSDVHVRMAQALGVRIAISSDAHRAEHMRYMPYGVATARRGWVTPETCLNAQPLGTVRSWLSRSRLGG